MCIKLIKNNEEVSYLKEVSLKDQLPGTKEIVIDYNPEDSSLGYFLDEIENYTRNGTLFNYKIKVLNNNHISGMKTKKKIASLQKDFQVNDLITKMVDCYEKTDKTLEELALCCLSKKD